jgi:tetratricopeptide (TPR) repeat protein
MVTKARMNFLDQLGKATELHKSGQVAEAEKIYLSILEVDPQNVDAKHLLGLVRGEQDRDREAVSLITEAIEAKPREAAFHHNIAGIYRRMGKLADAEAEFRTAIKLEPDYGEAYQGLSEVVTFSAGDPLIDQTISQVQRLDLDDRIKSYFYFAAAKMHADTEDYDTAFRCYQNGNKSANRTFDTKRHRIATMESIYIFSRYYLRGRPKEGNESQLPVFIVGMPRSGTTLIEQILASHSNVYGAGELNNIKHIAQRTTELSHIKSPYPQCVPMLKQGAIDKIANDYLVQVQQLAGSEDVTRIVDKHPLNFMNIGLILMMFPNAKIIHTVRDPIDTCLSCYFQNFTRGQDYSFDIAALAHFYNDYSRLMEHWKSLFPGKILDFHYENMIENQEAESRRLIEYCGLAWEDQCLQFHKTRRSVKTASFMQVRQPIYQSSIGRWKKYQHHLGQLAQILGINLAAEGQKVPLQPTGSETQPTPIRGSTSITTMDKSWN